MSCAQDSAFVSHSMRLAVVASDHITRSQTSPPRLTHDAQGPVSQCRDFDFTLKFSNIILCLLPSACLVAICHFRLPALASKKDLAPGVADPVGTFRVAVAALHALFNAASLALVATRDDLSVALDAQTIIPAISLSFVAAVSLPHRKFLKRNAKVCD